MRRFQLLKRLAIFLIGNMLPDDAVLINHVKTLISTIFWSVISAALLIMLLVMGQQILYYILIAQGLNIYQTIGIMMFLTSLFFGISFYITYRKFKALKTIKSQLIMTDSAISLASIIEKTDIDLIIAEFLKGFEKGASDTDPKK